MEIPTVRTELYREDRTSFAQQIGTALTTVEVFQIDGLNQPQLDELYAMSEAVFDRYLPTFKEGDHLPAEYRYERIRGNNYLHYQQTLVLTSPNLIMGNQRFKYLAKRVMDNFAEIYQEIAVGLNLFLTDSHHNPISVAGATEDPIIVRYLSGQEREDRNEDVTLVKEHCDGRKITLSPKATKPGLEGFINDEWVPLSPESGHVLVFAGDPLKKKIKPLVHRVRVHFPFTESRTALVYG